MRARFKAISAAWGGPRAPGVPKVPEDLSFGSLLGVPAFARALEDHRRLPIGFEPTWAEVLAIDLASTFCFAVSGGKQTGKTTLLKAMMLAAAAQGGACYVFDGGARELSVFARENGAEAYACDADELFDLLGGTIIPEFVERNRAKAAFIQGGRRDVDAYLGSRRKLFLFVNDMTAFCEAVYNGGKDMKGFVEQMVQKGDGHMIYVVACVAPGDMTGDHAGRKALRGFASWKTGVHLGGRLDDQRVFDFELPLAERARQLPPGQGHLAGYGQATRFVAARA